MSNALWHYTLNGARQSPIAESQLQQMAGDGRLQAGDLVWREGMARVLVEGAGREIHRNFLADEVEPYVPCPAA